MTHVEPEFTLIETQEKLEEFCRLFAAAEALAVDTEFVREKYYFPRLEVVQISDGHTIALIDVQAVKDLACVAELLGNREILKIFHAADQDLEVLQLDLKVLPLPMFDTQVAASLLGYGSQISLANLVRNLVGADSGTSQSVTDWTHRPLTREQLVYAATDVLHLHEVHRLLHKELTTRGRESWYEDEQADRVESAKLAERMQDDELYRRVKDWVSLSRKDLAVLRELAAWREQTARQRNVPRRQVFTDEGLVDLARFKPDSRQKAMKLRRVNPGHMKRHYDELMAVIERGRKIPSDQWPDKPTGERVEIPTGLLELCQALLRTEAEKHDIAPTVIATTSDLQQVILFRDAMDEKHTPLLHGWRRELVGEKLLALLQGRLCVTVGEGGVLEFGER